MDTLLDTELGHQHIEGSFQDANDSSLSDNGTVLLGQVRDEYTEVQVGGLLLCKSSAFLLAVDIKILVGVQNLNKGSAYMLHC